MTVYERTVAWIYDHRWLSMLAVLGVTGVAGWQAGKVGVDNSLEVWFLEQDPALTAYRDFQRAFGNDEMVVIALVREGGMLSPEGYDVIRRATAAVDRVDEVAEVRSLATVPDVRQGARGPTVVPLLPDSELNEAQAKAVKERILKDPLVRGKLVSADGGVAVLLCRLKTVGDIDAHRGAILARIDDALEKEGVGYSKAGVGVMYEGLNKASTEDSAIFIIASYVLIAVLLWLLYRCVATTVISLVAAGLAAVWTTGLCGAFGRDINMVSMVLPTLVFIIGLADSVHIFMFVAKLPRGDDRRHRVVWGVGHMLKPCLFNTLTTAAAFCAFAASRMLVIRDFGLFAAAGLLCAFVTTIVVSVWALHWQGSEPQVNEERLLQRFVSRIADVAIGRPKTVLAATLAVVLLSAVGVSRIVVDTYSMDFLPENHQVRQEARFVERAFGPYTPLEFIVEGNGTGTLTPEILAAVDAWQRQAETKRLAGWSFSVVDPIKKLYAATSTPNEHGTGALPESVAHLDALLEVYRAQATADFARWVDGAERLRVSFGIPMASAATMGRTVKAIEVEAANAKLPSEVVLTPTGYVPLYVQMMEYVVDTQISSFVLALAVVFLLIGLLFRSRWALLLAVPANLLPVLFVLGLMGLLGIRLDVATVTIGAIVLGLVVDDTVHFLHRLRHEMPRAANGAEGAKAAVRRVGTALLTTTFVLSLGFAVLGFAQAKSVAYFGLLLAAALISAVVADLLVTPAIVALAVVRLSK